MFQSIASAVAATILVAVVVVLLPHPAQSMTFGVVGDWGMGGYAVGWFPEVRSELQFREQCTFLGCNFTISVGDNVYCGDVGECMQRSFIEGFQGVGGPFFPSIGNHDNAGAQIGYKHPQWKFLNQYYYAKMPIDSTGYTVQVFAVNTMDGSLSGGGQFSWLEQELAKSDARWKILFGHYPTVGSGRHKRVGTVNRIHEIMHKHNAQAYFCGHDHIVEMSNLHGRLLGLSGGISRGGMMNRGIGGPFRRFTLTSPGEYNDFPPDWPTHGFLTVDLSPNVMTVNLFEANGGMYYESSVTWNWMKDLVSKQPDSLQHQFPAPEIVLQAFKDEITLPLGPGGGVVWNRDGTASPSSIQPKALAPGETAAPLTPAPLVTPSPVETPAPPVTMPPAAATVAPTDDKNAVPSFVKYSVASECAECDYTPVVDRPFTLYISGISVSSLNRIFLTSSALGCDVKEKPQLLPNTDVVTPGNNAVLFNVTGVATNAFVCFSVDKGSSYTRIKRSDSVFEEPDFVINPPVGQTTATPPTTERPPSSPTTIAPRGGTTAPAATDGGAHSHTTLFIVGAMCVAGGIVGSKYASKLFG
ncbi:serine-threonine protein phosphatase, putative [Bodo saltans]|uniref:Serine-threonine protein phosphatase, putative n=1 Tax=Bodo saltans TaxID=75058 RepID=A0A0S4KNU5_BODSA|nr:serine-threonine protein phosphatase, putative [Bodo saltans]|eukprot:CUI15297.1 serine-threonine protein phosphatase, putative [Bodo saltans]